MQGRPYSKLIEGVPAIQSLTQETVPILVLDRKRADRPGLPTMNGAIFYDDHALCLLASSGAHMGPCFLWFESRAAHGR